MKNIILYFYLTLTLSCFGQRLIDLKCPTYDHCTEVYGDNLFVFGGSNCSTKSYKLNLKNEEWTELSSQFSKISGATSQLYKDKVYIFGGSGFQNNVQIYDIENDTWELSPNTIPIGLYWSTSEIYNNKVYLIGGYFAEAEDGHGLDVMQIFDLKTQNWQMIKMPFDFRTPNSIKLNDLFYVWEHNLLYTYNPKTDEWQTVNLPDNIIKSWQEAEVYQGSILFMGGTDGTHLGATAHNYITRYNPKTALIKRLKDSSKFCRQYNYGTIVYDENLYIVGGRACKSWNSIDKIEVIENLE